MQTRIHISVMRCSTAQTHFTVYFPDLVQRQAYQLVYQSNSVIQYPGGDSTYIVYRVSNLCSKKMNKYSLITKVQIKQKR